MNCKITPACGLTFGVSGGLQPRNVLEALLKFHPDRENLDTVMNTLLSEDFNGALWLQRNEQSDVMAKQLAGLPRSQVALDP